MAKQTPILKKSRTHDAINVTMRDILAKELFTNTELNGTCVENVDYSGLNIYIDYYEYTKKILFNLSINSEPGFKRAQEYEMYLVSGNNNEIGREPYRICGEIVEMYPDTLVSFNIPVEGEDVAEIFSRHKNGYGYANYAIYAVLVGQNPALPGQKDARERLLMCKGKIYKTNVLYDLTESVLDGQ